jgi:hypothetical protein
MESRPGESHPRPLAERCGSLSTHTAPIKQTHHHPVTPAHPAPGVSVRCRFLLHPSVSSCCQLNSAYNRLTRPLCSGRITSLPRSYGSVRPRAPLRYARLVVIATCASPLTSERRVPAVPHESLNQGRALYTPVATRPVPQVSGGLFPGDRDAPGFDDMSLDYDASTRVHLRSPP